MKKTQLLFVTYPEKDFDDGLSYAIGLAKTMDRGIDILLIYRKKKMERFVEMTAATFAENNEHEKALEIMREAKSSNGNHDVIPEILTKECREQGITVNVYSTMRDTVSAIKNLLKSKTGIDMVLLSPSVTGNGNLSARELNRLTKTISRSVVTIARRAYAV